MGYAQHVRSPKAGSYYLARYRMAGGRLGTVKDELGGSVHYERKTDARKAANDAEADVRAGRLKQAAAEPDALTFGQWASSWYAALNLAASTMDNYKRHLELHVLPQFENTLLRPRLEILPPDVETWKQQLRDDGYSDGSIQKNYLATFRSCLAYAKKSGVIPFNPAVSGDAAGQGKRGVARAAAARASTEKVITTVLGGLLIAERAAVLSGRDDEFILTALLQHAGLRLGEGIGLEARYAGPGVVHVEWQLSEVGSRLIRAIPKDGSRGDVAVPPFLSDLLTWLAHQRPPVPCACHGLAYLFTGPGGARKPRTGVTVRDVAAAAGVAPESAWAALADDSRMPQAVRARVRAAAKDLGWQAGSAPLDVDWHWRHSGFERLVAAAASGWWAAAGKSSPEHPVWLAGEWPGATVVRYTAKRAEWCWLPVARGLTPHGLRHSLRTWMEEHQVPHVLAEAQMRHEQAGIDVYRHVTEGMRADYRGQLQAAWDEALQRRGELHPGSPVRVVDALLRQASDGFVARNSQGGTVTAIRGRR